MPKEGLHRIHFRSELKILHPAQLIRGIRIELKGKLGWSIELRQHYNVPAEAIPQGHIPEMTVFIDKPFPQPQPHRLIGGRKGQGVVLHLCRRDGAGDSSPVQIPADRSAAPRAVKGLPALGDNSRFSQPVLIRNTLVGLWYHAGTIKPRSLPGCRLCSCKTAHHCYQHHQRHYFRYAFMPSHIHPKTSASI